MLEYNGYSFRNRDNQFVFKHSAVDSIGLAIVLFIAALLIIFLMAYNVLIGVGGLLLVLFIFIPIIKRSKGRSQLAIDPTKQLLKVVEIDESSTTSFKDVDGVYTHSKFVDEYTSAFKSTSKEYRITIGVEVDQRQIPLFKLIADHAKPSKEMNEVHEFLETVIRNGRSIQPSRAV